MGRLDCLLSVRRFGQLLLVVALLVWALLWWGGGARAQPDEALYTVDLPDQLLSGVPTEIGVTALGERPDQANVELEVGGETYSLAFGDGAASAEVVPAGDEPTVRLLEDGQAVAFSTSPDGSDSVTETTVGTIPGWTSLLPPAIAIGIALAFRQVIPALRGVGRGVGHIRIRAAGSVGRVA
jgi:hypothetical protein